MFLSLLVARCSSLGTGIVNSVHNLTFRSFGSVLSPVEFSAQCRLTSELLRFLLRIAASKQTSWLSEQHHILSHSAHIRDLS